jgi:hypothetical protein
MGVLPCTVKAHINRAQRNRSHAREDQETESIALGFRVPGTRLLLVLERVNAEEELGDGEEEHDAEEDGDVPCWGCSGTTTRAGVVGGVVMRGGVRFATKVKHLDDFRRE